MIEDLEGEIWKDIPDYEGLYQISSTGRVKSVYRNITGRWGKLVAVKEKVLKPQGVLSRYYKVSLSKNNIIKNASIHQLVAIAFLGHQPNGHSGLVVDHINHNIHDNRLENLRLITQRENAGHLKNKGSSQYTGVHWCKRSKKWISSIRINNKLKNLGRFSSEYDAYITHEKALKEVLEND